MSHKPHTNEMTVTVDAGRKSRTYRLPLSMRHEIESFIASQLKQAAIEKSIPAEKVLPELADDTQRPATMLRGARYKAGMTQKELAAALEIHQHHLSEMEHGKRPIGKSMARKLAEALDCDYKVFL
jgi:ribosome-binding protein aMBF1 (putative translation factor)